jgi:hypothetical protein
MQMQDEERASLIHLILFAHKFMKQAGLEHSSVSLRDILFLEDDGRGREKERSTNFSLMIQKYHLCARYLSLLALYGTRDGSHKDSDKYLGVLHWNLPQHGQE